MDYSRLRYVLWAPGYVLIAFVYFLPGEWGKGRNVAKGSRWWRYKHQLAPFLSITAYLLGIALLGTAFLADTRPQ